MKKVLLLIPALVLAVALTLPVATPATACSGITLIAGGGSHEDEIIVGAITVSEDAEFIYVTYFTGGWQLKETHVAVGVCVNGTCQGIPLNKKGNPKVGNFPYSDSHGPDPTYQYQYAIPRDESWTAGTTLCIAAHAVVYSACQDQEETAWVGYCNYDERLEFPGRSWATYICYTVQ